MFNLIIRLILSVLLVSFFFIFGIFVENKKIFPYHQLRSLYSFFYISLKPNITKKKDINSILMDTAFLDKAISTNLINKKITSVDDLYQMNMSILMNRNGFSKAYKELKLFGFEQIEVEDKSLPIIKIKFKYQNKLFNTYLYGLLKKSCNNPNNTLGALIIPPTGNNESSKIYKKNKYNNLSYGIFDALNIIDKNDIFVFIKPNRDSRSWHNGSFKKINANFIYHWQYHMGGSYSLSYIVESLAAVKFLKKCYKKTILAGISQGATAVLLTSFQSEPDIAIMSSGHYPIASKIYSANRHQIYGIKEYGDIFDTNKLKTSLRKTKTKYLFINHIDNLFFSDHKKKNSLNLPKDLSNVTHEVNYEKKFLKKYPIEIIQKFLKQNYD